MYRRRVSRTPGSSAGPDPLRWKSRSLAKPGRRAALPGRDLTPHQPHGPCCRCLGRRTADDRRVEYRAALDPAHFGNLFCGPPQLDEDSTRDGARAASHQKSRHFGIKAANNRRTRQGRAGPAGWQPPRQAASVRGPRTKPGMLGRTPAELAASPPPLDGAVHALERGVGWSSPGARSRDAEPFGIGSTWSQLPVGRGDPDSIQFSRPPFSGPGTGPTSPKHCPGDGSHSAGTGARRTDRQPTGPLGHQFPQQSAARRQHTWPRRCLLRPAARLHARAG